MAVLWWRLHYFCHVRLGVNCMYVSNFCVLVWLPLSWRDFITLSDIIRMCGHVMDDVITLWWSRESWYDFSPSWLKFSSWCDFVCLGVILHLGAINWILIWFFFALPNFRLVRFCLIWYCFISWCDQRHLGMISFRLGVICLIWCYFVSWCE